MNTQLLFDQATALHRIGKLGEAERLYRQILETDPGAAETLESYGLLLQAAGRFEEALACYDKAVAVLPDNASVLKRRGDAQYEVGRFAEALLSYDSAIGIDPDNAKTHYNRGSTLRQLHRLNDALLSYNRTLVIDPRHVGALYNRGVALMDLGRLEEALTSFDRALAVVPDFAAAHNDRGNALSALKRPEEALASYDQALRIAPDYIEVLYNRGNVLTELARLEEAVASHDRALKLDPNHANAFHNRGNALMGLNRFAGALASYEYALAVAPDHPYAFGGAANAAIRLCDWPRTKKFAARIAAEAPIIPPFTVLGYSDDAALHLKYARRYVEQRIPVQSKRLWDGTAYRHGKIRIAYLSADFREHPVAFQLAELLECHDRTRFEVLCISIGPDDRSEIRARLMKSFDRFQDMRMKTDKMAAKLLRALEPDIIVDLNGHTQDARPGILSYRPAPVQVNYLGYPSTTGAEFIDYVIADPVILPFDQKDFVAEKIVHLPDSFWVSNSKRVVAGPPSRVEAGLPVEGFVFCSFNNHWKMTAPIFDIWMRLLSLVEGSVLWLKDVPESVKANLGREALARGIAPERLVFAPRVKLEDHLARHRLAGLFLDTLPYNAHATASDALWMGLPLVTCKGRSFPGRVAASLLRAAGLSELVTENLNDYEALALRLARDSEHLRLLRRKLEEGRATQALFDTERFRRNIEMAYIRMWEIAESGEHPQSFAVARDARNQPGSTPPYMS